MRRVVMFALTLAAAGCSQTVRIDSRPPGARCYLDGDFTGYTPLELDLGSGVRELRLESDGYRPVTGTMRRRFDPRSLYTIALPPLLLLPQVSTRLQARYLVELDPGTQEDDRGVIDGDDRPHVP